MELRDVLNQIHIEFSTGSSDLIVLRSKGLGRFCSKIRLLSYVPMLPTTSYYALGWVLLCLEFK